MVAEEPMAGEGGDKPKPAKEDLEDLEIADDDAKTVKGGKPLIPN